MSVSDPLSLMASQYSSCQVSLDNSSLRRCSISLPPRSWPSSDPSRPSSTLTECSSTLTPQQTCSQPSCPPSSCPSWPSSEIGLMHFFTLLPIYGDLWWCHYSSGGKMNRILYLILPSFFCDHFLSTVTLTVNHHPSNLATSNPLALLLTSASPTRSPQSMRPRSTTPSSASWPM